MIKKLSSLFIAVAISMALSAPAFAHFQMIVPSTEIVASADSKEISLRLMFIHPMEGHSMDMATPTEFGVVAGGTKHDLLGTLRPVDYRGHSAFEATYKIRRPGDHVFWVEPAPY